MRKNGRIRNSNRKNSMFRKYFIISGTIIIVSFMIISFAIMIFVANQWWTDKVDGLLRNAQNISQIYTEQLYSKGKLV